MTERAFSMTAPADKQEIIMTYVFDAPRDEVFSAYTEPKNIPLWWGPVGTVTTVEVMSPKKGGLWRFFQTDPDGNRHAFHGVYHEVVSPERIISTFEYEGLPDPGHVILETVAFRETVGRTTLTDHMVFRSAADRDGMLASGMEKGSTESMNRLAELLRK
jgi:uncharacterized protein YndB with AHSA1/START domain